MSASQTQRPRFYEQQYLGSADLGSVVEYHRRARARHDLGAHTWGIAAGLRLVEKTSASSGQVEVFVQPGYAWDGLGRPILVLSDAPIPLQKFESIAYDAAIDNGDPKGRLVDVWIRYRERPVGSPKAGFEVCDVEDQYARVAEGYDIVVNVGDTSKHSNLHQEIEVGSVTADAKVILQTLGDSSDPTLDDESVPYQRFPQAWGDGKWLVPLGKVRFNPDSAGGAGKFVERVESGTVKDLTQSERFRRYVGVVAETVNAAGDVIRLRHRDADFTPTVWSEDLVWVEGNLRVDGDARLLGGRLMLRDGNDSDALTPLNIGRLARTGATGDDLYAQIGESESGENRFVVGPIASGNSAPTAKFVVRDDATVGIGVDDPGFPLEIKATGDAEDLLGLRDSNGVLKWHIDMKPGGKEGLNIGEGDTGSNDGRLFIASGGKVGVGTLEPSNALHVDAHNGIRQKDIYLSGGDGGSGLSALSFNAHRDDSNTGWNFPDPSRPALAAQLYDSGSTSGARFLVSSTTNASTQSWRERLRIEGESGNMYVCRNGGSVGIGTSSPLAQLHVTEDLVVADSVGIGTNSPAAQLHVDDDMIVEEGIAVGRSGAPEVPLHVEGIASGSPYNVDSHIAFLHNRSTSKSADVLALKVDNPGAVGDANNFITFMDSGGVVGAIEGIGGNVKLDTSGADFAEWLPRAEGQAPLPPGDIVGVSAGRVSRRAGESEGVFAVSTAPAVVGGRPGRSARSRHEQIALIGQVPVRVSGPVSTGDFIVPSGKEDGTGVAIRPDKAGLTDIARAVGIAWEYAEGKGPHLVRTAVGLHLAQALGHVARAIDALDAKIARVGKKAAPARGRARRKEASK